MGRGVIMALGWWGLIAGLNAVGVGQGTDPGDPGYLILCCLLVLAPTCAALPAGRIVRAPWWTLEVIVCWTVLGYLLLFVDPGTLGRGLALLVLLAALTGVLASPAILYAAWHKGQQAAWVRRQGYLLAGLQGGLLALRSLNALTPLTVSLFALIAVSLGGLLLSAARGERAKQALSRTPRGVTELTPAGSVLASTE